MNSSNVKSPNAYFLHGASMLPLIKPGSKVYVSQIDNCKLKPGDIICFFQNPLTFFAHRLVYFLHLNGKKYALEKGDNVYGFSLIPYEQILGKVTKIEDDKRIINLNSFPWRIANYILAKIASIHIFLLKSFPYSYHYDSKIKKIPHYLAKILFITIEKIFILLFSREK